MRVPSEVQWTLALRTVVDDSAGRAGSAVARVIAFLVDASEPRRALRVFSALGSGAQYIRVTLKQYGNEIKTQQHLYRNYKLH